jgi:hypothetical protein
MRARCGDFATEFRAAKRAQGVGGVVDDERRIGVRTTYVTRSKVMYAVRADVKMKRK